MAMKPVDTLTESDAETLIMGETPKKRPAAASQAAGSGHGPKAKVVKPKKAVQFWECFVHAGTHEATSH